MFQKFLPAFMALALLPFVAAAMRPVGDSIIAPCAHPRILLKKGTLISLRIAEKISSENLETGDVVRLRVEKAVSQGEITFISPGRFAQAQVTAVQPAGRFGRPARIRLEAVMVEAVDGQWVELTAGVISRSGRQDFKTGAIGASVAIPLIGLLMGTPWLIPFVVTGAFVKGPEAIIKQDTFILAKVKRDVYICP